MQNKTNTKSQTKNTPNNSLKVDIFEQFKDLESLNLTLQKRIELISNDVSFRYSIPFSKVKIIVQTLFIEYIPDTQTSLKRV